MNWIIGATAVIGFFITAIGLVSAITYNRDAAARHRAEDHEPIEVQHNQ